MDILIVSEDGKEAKQWQKMLAKATDNADVIVANKKDASLYLKENTSPDFIFLEVEQEADLQFTEKNDCPSPLVVVSSSAAFCLAAFQLNTFNYLVKPIDKEDVEQSISKYNKFFAKSIDADFLGDLQSLVKFVAKKEKSYKKRFMIKIGNTIKSISVGDIAYFFSQDKVSYLMHQNGKKYPVENTLDEIESMLNPEQFYRANRQYVVCINAISEIHPYFKGRVKLSLLPAQETDIVISSEKSRAFKDWLNR